MMELYVNRQSLNNFHVSVAERPDIPTPEMEVETIDVDGRDGALTIEKGYRDITFSVKLNILEDENLKPLFRVITAALLRAKEIYFSDDDIYYKVKQVSVGNIGNEFDCYGYFEPTFTCDPFQYGRDLPVAVFETAGKMLNPGTYFSRPLMRVYGRNGTVKVGGQTFELKGVQSSVPYVIVDSEMENAYYGTTNLNRFMSGPYPILELGTNDISFTGDITKIEIEPRWRYL